MSCANERDAEITAATLGEHDVAAAELVAGLEGRLVRAVASYAEIAGGDADDTVAVVEHLGRREAG